MTERALAIRERHYCSKCQTRYAERGMCPSHPREPLLDLGDPEARLVLADTDRLARMEHMGKIAGISLLVSVPLSIVLAVLVFPLLGPGTFLAQSIAILGQFGVIAVLALLGLLLFRRKPALALDEAEILALEAARETEEGPPLSDA